MTYISYFVDKFNGQSLSQNVQWANKPVWREYYRLERVVTNKVGINPFKNNTLVTKLALISAKPSPSVSLNGSHSDLMTRLSIVLMLVQVSLGGQWGQCINDSSL
jgi:hypothetical protein